MPTEDEFYQVILAVGNDDPFTCHRIAKAVHGLHEGKTVDEVLREDRERKG